MIPLQVVLAMELLGVDLYGWQWDMMQDLQYVLTRARMVQSGQIGRAPLMEEAREMQLLGADPILWQLEKIQQGSQAPPLL
jgi:hypothetical protein